MTWIVAAAIVLLVLLVFEFAAARIARSRYAPPGRLVDVGRRKLHVRTQGDAGPTVVFEAGAGSTSAAWTSVQREISTFARTLSYDRAGFGWSDPADGERTANALAEDLHAVLTAPDVAPPYVLVAHSLGGAIITQYASNHPDTVAGYVYVDAAFAELYVRFGEAFPKWIRRIARTRVLLRVVEPLGHIGLMRIMRFSIADKRLPEAERRPANALSRSPRFYRAIVVRSTGSSHHAMPHSRLPRRTSLPSCSRTASRTHSSRKMPPKRCGPNSRRNLPAVSAASRSSSAKPATSSNRMTLRP